MQHQENMSKMFSTEMTSCLHQSLLFGLSRFLFAKKRLMILVYKMGFWRTTFFGIFYLSRADERRLQVDHDEDGDPLEKGALLRRQSMRRINDSTAAASTTSAAFVVVDHDDAVVESRDDDRWEEKRGEVPIVNGSSVVPALGPLEHHDQVVGGLQERSRSSYVDATVEPEASTQWCQEEYHRIVDGLVKDVAGEHVRPQMMDGFGLQKVGDYNYKATPARCKEICNAYLNCHGFRYMRADHDGTPNTCVPFGPAMGKNYFEVAINTFMKQDAYIKKHKYSSAYNARKCARGLGFSWMITHATSAFSSKSDAVATAFESCDRYPHRCFCFTVEQHATETTKWGFWMSHSVQNPPVEPPLYTAPSSTVSYKRKEDWLCPRATVTTLGSAGRLPLKKCTYKKYIGYQCNNVQGITRLGHPMFKNLQPHGSNPAFYGPTTVARCKDVCDSTPRCQCFRYFKSGHFYQDDCYFGYVRSEWDTNYANGDPEPHHVGGVQSELYMKRPNSIPSLADAICSDRGDCALYTCPSGWKKLAESNRPGRCADTTCERTECCELTCGEYSCPDGWINEKNMHTRVCPNNHCTVGYCCEKSCKKHIILDGNSCNSGWVAKSKLGTRGCGNDDNCSNTECCQKTCQTFSCPNNWVKLSGANSIICASNTCNKETCCERTCATYTTACPNNWDTLAQSTRCGSSAACVRADCCAKTCAAHNNAWCGPSKKIYTPNARCPGDSCTVAQCCKAACGTSDNACSDPWREKAGNGNTFCDQNPCPTATCCEKTCKNFNCNDATFTRESNHATRVCSGNNCNKAFCCQKNCKNYNCPSPTHMPKVAVANLATVGCGSDDRCNNAECCALHCGSFNCGAHDWEHKSVKNTRRCAAAGCTKTYCCQTTTSTSTTTTKTTTTTSSTTITSTSTTITSTTTSSTTSS
ncbi:unnamed protein product, partial [Amoebophrya sp. A25]|eukprot:GSA25T00025659001.1